MENFWVATKLGKPGVFCRDRIFLCCNKVGQGKEKLCHDRIFLCRDKDGQGKEKLCRDRAILCHDRAGHDRKFVSHDRDGHAKAMRARQTRLGAHSKRNRGALPRTIETLCRP